ncbi:probable E3 ubiquitin-protein ligase RGLG2 at N-terminal half [Coccomyxa sp. Obi]|nr:probable E3 ubiquitin-protein ligase RGLG2 at N-terminal half [Coccomyxa sp. Obi]
MGGCNSKGNPIGPVQGKRSTTLQFRTIKDNFNRLEEVQNALRINGLESSQLIIGIDFTKSNTWSGKHSFGGLSLHHVGQQLNPYEQAISIVARTLAPFDDDNQIPAYGFGDESTHDTHVFSLLPRNQPCQGLEQVLWRYRTIAPHVKLAGPTSFAPLIHQAMRDVAASGMQYHILLLLADGQVTRSVELNPGEYSNQERATMDAIVMASNFPLSIVMVGVGDGPFDMMREFDDALPTRRFDNFQFVDMSRVMRETRGQPPEKAEALFALRALMEIPDQYRTLLRLGLIGGAPNPSIMARLMPPALGPPPAVLAAERVAATAPSFPGSPIATNGSFGNLSFVPHSQAQNVPHPHLHAGGPLGAGPAASSSHEDLIEERLRHELQQQQVPTAPYPSLSYTVGISTPPPSAYASPSVAAPADRPIGQDSSTHGVHGARLDLDEPDPMFLCPITQDVMKDPVMAADGYTYERLAIESWLENHVTSPISNEQLPNKSLIANHSLRSAILEWQQRHSAGT